MMKKVFLRIVFLIFTACLLQRCEEEKKFDVDETIYINHSILNLFYGEKIDLTVSPLSGTYRWSSEDTSIATVNEAGEVKAVGVGSTNITVTNGNVLKSIPLTVTIPAIHKVIGRPGKERAQIEVEILTELIKSVRIIRLDTDEYMDVDINYTKGTFIAYYDNLQEAKYPFRVISLDQYGMESVPSELEIQVYGSIYQEKIIPRETKAISAFGNGLAIGWGNEAGAFLDLTYRDKNGQTVTKRVASSDQASYLFDYNQITPFSYITGYLPEATAVDTFYTQPVAINVEKINSIISKFTASSETIIAAGHFDIGGDGIGYHDSDGTNSANNYKLRENLGDFNSRGVDVEGGGNIGYTNPGEWLRYTVYVEDPGKYAIDFLISVNGTSAKCYIDVDGKKSTMYNLINNSSWGDYRYYCEHNQLEPPTYELTSGFHSITFHFETGNFNFNGLKAFFTE